ncbi:phage terminase large subunit family protein [Microcystis wesenbergii]|nr:phage terminase large subunit family protein [Microcystis wesenbergii]MBD2115796.1 phage terminase large subunit family protein [Microcystis wesenbergii FACHB-1339]
MQTATAFQPPPRLTLSEWADTYRRLSPESSAEPGQWRTARTPYLKEIMDSIGTCERVVFIKSSQVGGTELINNLVGYYIHQDPAPILSINPTLEMAETWSKDRLMPMLRDSPALVGKIDTRSRKSGNTILTKKFPGGHITMAGANSPSSLASRPVRVVVCDEVDRYPFSAGFEGDPVELAVKRTTTFWNRRVVLVSTPTIRGASRIESEYERSDKRRYFIPCPHCGQEQHLVWGQVKWDPGDPEGAWYECIDCGKKIEHRHKQAFLRAGRWVATQSGSKVAGFHINELYSPWKSFGDVAKDFLKAKDDLQLLKVWVNTSLGESFDETGGEGIEWQHLSNRAEPYQPLTVPHGGLLVTAGVDVQGDRLSVGVYAWGPGEESWLIYSIELYGDPTESKVWEDLDVLLLSKFTHAGGSELAITAAAIDSGFKPNEVYNFVRRRAGRNLYAVKGMSTAGKPVIGKPTYQEVTYKGQVLKKGVRLWPVGSDTVKGIIYSRLQLKNYGPGYIHFPIGLDSEYYEQLCAEKLQTKYVKGFPRQEWVKIRSRNEALDCLVYAYAAATALGIARIDWNKLRESLTPQIEEKLEEVVNVPKVREQNKFQYPRSKKGNFASSW